MAMEETGGVHPSSTNHQPLFLYDFDGTLTSKDSLLAFLMFAKGKLYTFLLLACYSPLLILMVLRFYPNGKAKERIFAHCFKGMLEKDFNNLCKQFADNHVSILKTDKLKDVARALDEGGRVMVVTASIHNWVEPLLNDSLSSIHHSSFEIVGTEIEVINGRLTGRFSTPNCHGQEKVNRIQTLIPNRQDYYVVAYGDSKGDKEMLAWADEGHLVGNEKVAHGVHSPSNDSSFTHHSSINEVIRFGIVGVLAVAIQYFIYLLMVKITSPGIANTIAYLVSFTFNFFASTYFTFRVKANARRGAGFALSHVINYLLQMGSLHLFLWIGISKEWAPLPMFCICVPVNFLLVRFFLKR